MLKEIDAAIFDMDGTLIDSMGIWEKVDFDFLSKRNIAVPADILKQIEGLSFDDTAVYFKEKFSLSDEIEDIKNEWLDMVRDYYENTIPLKDGVAEFLYKVKKSGKKIGLATSNSLELSRAVLKRTGILDYFDVIVTSSDVGKDKSCPDIYLKTAEELNTPPEKCIVFEDTLSGITGARKAGMKVVAVYDKYSLSCRDQLLSKADRYINSFREIA